MKSNIILVTLLVILLLSANIYADFDTDKETFNKLFSYEDSKLEKLFHESFLKQISVAKIIEILSHYKSNLGLLKDIESSGDSYTLIFENGTVPAKISINEEQKIIGLWFGNFTLSEDNLVNILTDFKNLQGEVSICVLRNNEETLLSYNENIPLAVGSSFKLYVLKALYEIIRSSDRSWDDIIRLNNKNKSLPSGILQQWPESTPLTVKTLSNLMISISDNTATDHLIDYIEREEIENYVSKGNRPFLI